MSTADECVSQDRRTVDTCYVDAAQNASPFTRIGPSHGHEYFRQFRKGLGGNIEVESKLEKGTTFIITLPVARPSSRSEGLPKPRGSNDG